MGQTIYSHSVRILTCMSCGAPLQATLEGGSFTCDYCGVTQVVSRRLAASEVTSSTDLSESERYNQLRTQEGRVDPMPPAIARLMNGTRLRNGAAGEARTLWAQTRVQLGRAPSFPLAQKLFYLTVVLAPALPERDRRAILETAGELLPDVGHRHVFHCMLSRLASCAGDLDAARGWLAGTDHRPTDLLMDTLYRIAAGTLASAENDPSRVLELFGMGASDVPIAASGEADAFYLRIDALARLSQGGIDELRQRIATLGLPIVRSELSQFGRLALCADSLRMLEAELAAQAHALALTTAERSAGMAAAQLESHRGAWNGVMTSAFLGSWLAATLILAVPWTVLVSGILDHDPLFGAHARVICPLLCEGCTAPYQFRYWTRGGKNHSSIECRRVNASGELQRTPSLEGGSFQLAATMIPVCSPLGLLFGLAAVVIARKRWRSRERWLKETVMTKVRERDRLANQGLQVRAHR